jgi:hypothetical protein
MCIHLKIMTPIQFVAMAANWYVLHSFSCTSIYVVLTHSLSQEETNSFFSLIRSSAPPHFLAAHSFICSGDGLSLFSLFSIFSVAGCLGGFWSGIPNPPGQYISFCNLSNKWLLKSKHSRVISSTSCSFNSNNMVRCKVFIYYFIIIIFTGLKSQHVFI